MSASFCFLDGVGLILLVNFNSFVYAIQEDFQAMTYGFKMANNVTDLRVTGIVRTLNLFHCKPDHEHGGHLCLP